MAQTKVQLLQPDLGDVIDFDASTLFVDGADNRIGIRNTDPQYELDVTGTVRATNFIGNISTGTIDDWIVHTGDTNTKFGFPTADEFEVHAGGGPRLRISSAGNIGINESSPQTDLHIGSGGKFRFERSDGTRYGELWNDNSFVELKASTDPIRINGQSYIRLDIADNEKVRITSTQVASFGNSSPPAWQDSNGYYNLQLGNAGYFRADTDASSNFLSFGLNAYRDSSGWKFIEDGRATQVSHQAGEIFFNVSNSGNAAGAITFVEAFRIGSTGNVSVGNNPTVHSDNIFHVEDSGETNVKFEGDTTTLGARLQLQNNNTGAGALNQIDFNDAGGQSTSSIKGFNTDQTNNYGELAFFTRDAQGSPPAERVRITKDGLLHISDRNSSNAGEHILQGGSFGIRMQDTGGYNRWNIERNYGGWQSTPIVHLSAQGRVGINQDSPGCALNVKSIGSASDGLQVTSSSHSSYFWQIQNNDNLFNGSLAGELGIRGSSGIGFSANAGTSCAVRIKSDGNVLVGGHTNPLSTYNSSQPRLSIYKSTGSGGYLELGGNQSSDGHSAGTILFINDNNADGANNDADGKILAMQRVEIETTDSNSGDDSGGHLVFQTKPESGNLDETMRLTAGHELCLGRSSSIADAKLAIQCVTTKPAIAIQCNHSNTDTDLIKAYNSGGTNLCNITVETDNSPYLKVQLWSTTTSSALERFRINHLGNVAIGGGTAASNRLEITNDHKGMVGDSAQPNATFLIKHGTSGSDRRWIGIGASTSTAWMQSSSPGGSGLAAPFEINPGGGDITLGNDRVRIESGGDVGINTLDGDFGQTNGASQFAQGDPKLGVLGSVAIANFSTTTTDYSELAFYRRHGSTAGANGRLQSTHNLGRISWYGSSNDTSFPDKVWSIQSVANGGDWWAGSARRASLQFHNQDGQVLSMSSSGFIHAIPRKSMIEGAYVYRQRNQSQNYEHRIRGPHGSFIELETYDNMNAEITVNTVGTSTRPCFCKYRFTKTDGTPGTGSLQHIAGGSSANSNVPYMVISSNEPRWKMNHAGGYYVIVRVVITGGDNGEHFTSTGEYFAN